jgi:predicted enzyme related to lactoylglutathione lyase
MPTCSIGGTPQGTIQVRMGIDDALKQIEPGGGSTLIPRTPISGMGGFAYIQDPEGKIIGPVNHSLGFKPNTSARCPIMRGN